MLRAPEVRSEAERAAGVDKPRLEWDNLVAYRNYMIRNLDDSEEIESYRSSGVDVDKGTGTMVGPGAVGASGGPAHRADLSSRPIPIRCPADRRAGRRRVLDHREVTALNEVPSSVVVLGGGPVGIELAQFLRRFDAEVLVESAERLLARKDPAVSELLVETLRAEGIERLGVQA